MRFRLPATLLFVLISFQAVAADNSPGKAAIKKVLLSSKSWTVYFEDNMKATVPTDDANRWKWGFFEEDGKMKARQLGWVFGSCVHEITLHDDGFSFKYCPVMEHQNEVFINYHPEDSQYPFKVVDERPGKWWLHPDE